MQILVDADSCPRAAREMLLRFSSRLGIKSVFAANRPMPGIASKYAKTALMEICPKSEGAADNRIVELAGPGDLVVTRDLPLAERLVDMGITVLDDRGRLFTKENIRELRSLRDFTVGLAENGLDFERTASYSKKDVSALAKTLDKELNKLKGKREEEEELTPRHKDQGKKWKITCAMTQREEKEEDSHKETIFGDSERLQKVDNANQELG